MIFRIVVFGESETTKGRGKKARIVKQGYAYILWNPCEETAASAGRPGFGSFAWYGMGLARRAALTELQKPGITQVSIRTNQDQQVARLFRARMDEYTGQLTLGY